MAGMFLNELSANQVKTGRRRKRKSLPGLFQSSLEYVSRYRGKVDESPMETSENCQATKSDRPSATNRVRVPSMDPTTGDPRRIGHAKQLWETRFKIFTANDRLSEIGSKPSAAASIPGLRSAKTVAVVISVWQRTNFPLAHH